LDRERGRDKGVFLQRRIARGRYVGRQAEIKYVPVLTMVQTRRGAAVQGPSAAASSPKKPARRMIEAIKPLQLFVSILSLSFQFILGR
jgi:hypothetical protein